MSSPTPEERDRLAEILSIYTPVIRDAEDWRPVADYVLERIEAAVAAERERCAEITRWFRADLLHPQEDIRIHIARAIREGA